MGVNFGGFCKGLYRQLYTFLHDLSILKTDDDEVKRASQCSRHLVVYSIKPGGHFLGLNPKP